MSNLLKFEAYAMPNFAQLPNEVNWTIKPSRVVLLIHDMQEYFIQFIPSKELTEPLIENISLLRSRCKSLNIPIAYTAQPGSMTDKQRGLLKDFWGSGMKAVQNERKIVDKLTPESKDWIFTKWRYSAFYQSNLLQRLKDSGRNQLIICGVYAHIGILTTALEAFSNDIQAFLVPNAIGDFTEANHHMAVNYVARCCAVNLLAEEILA